MFSGLKWTTMRQSGRSKREQSSVRIKSGRSFWIFPAWKWEVQKFGGKTVHFRPYWFFQQNDFWNKLCILLWSPFGVNSSRTTLSNCVSDLILSSLSISSILLSRSSIFVVIILSVLYRDQRTNHRLQRSRTTWNGSNPFLLIEARYGTCDSSFRIVGLPLKNPRIYSFGFGPSNTRPIGGSQIGLMK